MTRDIVLKIKGKPDWQSAFAHPLMLARRVREQRQNQRGKKVYSLHAPEVECIGKGKAHIGPTSSASRCRSPRRFVAARVASSSPI